VEAQENCRVTASAQSYLAHRAGVGLQVQSEESKTKVGGAQNKLMQIDLAVGLASRKMEWRWTLKWSEGGDGVERRFRITISCKQKRTKWHYAKEYRSRHISHMSNCGPQ